MFVMLLQWNREGGSREEYSRVEYSREEYSTVEYSTVEKSTVEKRRVQLCREGRKMLIMMLQWNREGESREE